MGINHVLVLKVAAVVCVKHSERADLFFRAASLSFGGLLISTVTKGRQAVCSGESRYSVEPLTLHFVFGDISREMEEMAMRQAFKGLTGLSDSAHGTLPFPNCFIRATRNLLSLKRHRAPNYIQLHLVNPS